MNLYIPEIGDHIILTEDWNFQLHAEERNNALAAFFGFYQKGFNGGWLKEDELPPLSPFDYSKIPYPKTDHLYWNERRLLELKAQEECIEYQEWLKEDEIWRKRAEELLVKYINITIPSGTVLSIDRIYIRKGVSDYSSITFFAKGLGETEVRRGWRGDRKQKVKSMRFWAKLDDCNKIKFEKHEKIS